MANGRLLIWFFIKISLALEYSELDLVAGPVIHVAMVYRHGERAPIQIYKNDPYQDIDKYWPAGLGELTEKGKYHLYQLGQWTRSNYIHLIDNGLYSPKDICSWSVDTSRNIMSAQAHLAGMFPPNKGKFLKIKWQPIPIRIEPVINLGNDYYSDRSKSANVISYLFNNCKKYKEEFYKFAQQEKMNITKKYEWVFKYLEDAIGEKFDSAFLALPLFSTLTIEEGAGLKLPNWAKDPIYPKELTELNNLAVKLFAYNDKMKRLYVGPMLKKIMIALNSKFFGDKLSRCSNITMYSDHDTTLSTLMETLGVNNGIPVPFGSMLMIELRKNFDGRHFVTISYKNQTNPFDMPYVLDMKKCSTPCDYKQFFGLTYDFIPEDWNKECNY